MEIPDELVEEMAVALNDADEIYFTVANDGEKGWQCRLLHCKLSAIQERAKLEHDQTQQKEMLLLAAFIQLPLSLLNSEIDDGRFQLSLANGGEAVVSDLRYAIESGLVAMSKAGLLKPTGALGEVLTQSELAGNFWS